MNSRICLQIMVIFLVIHSAYTQNTLEINFGYVAPLVFTCDSEPVTSSLEYTYPIVEIQKEWGEFEKSTNPYDKTVVSLLKAIKDKNSKKLSLLLCSASTVEVSDLEVYAKHLNERFFSTPCSLYVVGKIPISRGYEYVINVSDANRKDIVVWEVVEQVNSGRYVVNITNENLMIKWLVATLRASGQINLKNLKSVDKKRMDEEEIFWLLKNKSSSSALKKVIQFRESCKKSGLTNKFTVSSEKNAENLLNNSPADSKQQFINECLDKINDPLMAVDAGKIFIVMARTTSGSKFCTLYHDSVKGLLFTNIGSESLFDLWANKEIDKAKSVLGF